MGGITSKNRYRPLRRSMTERSVAVSAPLWETWCTSLLQHPLYPRVARDAGRSASRFEVKEIPAKTLQRLARDRREARFEDGIVMLRGSDGAVRIHLKVLLAACWDFNDFGTRYSYRDLIDFTKRDLVNFVNFIYYSVLPSDIGELFSLNQLAEYIHYRPLAVQTSQRLIEQHDATTCDEALLDLVNLVRKSRMPTLYESICVELARYAHDPSILFRLDPSILTDVLVQDCLAVDNEDEVASFVTDFYVLHPRYGSADVARCVRSNFLSDAARRWFAFESGIVWEPRHSFEGHYVSIDLQVTLNCLRIVCTLTFDRVWPDQNRETLLTVEDSSGYDTLSNSGLRPQLDHVAGAEDVAEYRTEIQIVAAATRRLLFVRLGSAVVRVDLCTTRCELLLTDVSELYVDSDGYAEAVSRTGARRTLTPSRAEMMLCALLTTPCDRLAVNVDEVFVSPKDADSVHSADNSDSGHSSGSGRWQRSIFAAAESSSSAAAAAAILL